MRTDLVSDALRAAAAQRGDLTGAISTATTERLCQDLGVTRSMGAVGTSADPLQHPPPALLLWAPQPQHLRDHQHRRYAATRRVTINRVSMMRGQGPSC